MSDMPDPRWFPLLVTGGSGFVGAAVLRRLAAERPGPGAVHALVHSASAAGRLKDIGDEITLHACTLADRAAVRAVVERVKPRTILHLAAAGAHDRAAGLRQMAEVNMIGTLHLLEAAGDAGAALFVNAGSSSEYGVKTRPMRETDADAPATLYGVTKSAQTHLCAALAAARGLDAVTLRLFSVYGPGEKADALIPAAIRAVREGAELRLGDPDAMHDFIYIEDAVDALLGFDRFTGLRGEVFNIGTGVGSTNRQVVEAVAAELDQPAWAVWGALPARAGDSPMWVADPAAAAARLGWKATIALREGIRLTAGWMRERDARPAA